jgi:uncharacterized damage-inducible protein DinB
MSTPPEAWLRGPIAGIDPYLMPAAHALVQASEDLARAAGALTPAELWIQPGGAASIGFHLKHIAGSIDRLLTYARGESLSQEQRAALAAEGSPDTPPEEAAALIALAQGAIVGAIEVLRGTPHAALLEPRSVGRAALPTTVLGLLMHIGEHTQRHTGQVITTAKIVRGLRLAGR